MPKDSSISRRRRRYWILGLTFGLGCLVIFLFARSQHRRTDQDLEALRKAGYPVTLAELDRWYAPVPAEENAALKIIEAIGQLPAAVPLQHAWPLSLGDSLSAEERSILRLTITNNQKGLELVREAASLQKSRYPCDLSQGASTVLTHLPDVKKLVQHLRAFTILFVEEGEIEQAAESFTNAVAVSLSLASEPTLISQLVRISCLAIAHSGFERLINQHQLPDGQLRAISECMDIAEAKSSEGMKHALIGELCLCLHAFKQSPGQAIFGTTNTQHARFIDLAFGMRKAIGLDRRDYVLFRRVMDAWIECSDLSFPENLLKAGEISRQFKNDTRGYRRFLHPLSSMLLPAVDRALVKQARSCALLRLAQVVAAIERHRLAHGNELPEDLNQLVPALLAQIPKDPFDGQPIRYRKLDKGYLVYSVGEDRRDDKGVSGADVFFPVGR
jgi:hypothetical protein